MQEKHSARWISVVVLVLATAGFLLPLWPLSALAIAVAVGYGQLLVSIILGLLFDIAWGAPPNAPPFLLFPFTLLALFGCVVRFFSMHYLRGRMPLYTIE